MELLCQSLIFLHPVLIGFHPIRTELNTNDWRVIEVPVIESLIVPDITSDNRNIVLIEQSLVLSGRKTHIITSYVWNRFQLHDWQQDLILLGYARSIVLIGFHPIRTLLNIYPNSIRSLSLTVSSIKALYQTKVQIVRAIRIAYDWKDLEICYVLWFDRSFDTTLIEKLKSFFLLFPLPRSDRGFLVYY